MTSQKILVLAEKPNAGRRIAEALSTDGKIVLTGDGVIEVARAFDGMHYVVCSALGHLYELSDCQETRGVFPVLDADWFPRAGSSKATSHNHPRLNDLIGRKIVDIASICSRCSKLVNACDFDTEGETIGFNAFIFASSNIAGSRQIFRAKFSTLTTEEIRESFRTLAIDDVNLAKAGRMRHLTDFVWGVNLSRALTLSICRNGGNRTSLTMGRVQGPTLAFVVERELDRRIHVPVPAWLVSCLLEKEGCRFTARSVDSPFGRKASAMDVYRAASSAKMAKSKKIDRSIFSVLPRYPFDLGELQREAHRLFKISPNVTISIAQKLYQNALISYPRTDSQKLPEKIGPLNILKKLSSISEYSDLVRRLLSDPRRRPLPIEGPKDDPAHPAIYPTGENPNSSFSGIEKRIFDLIVRRFCNCYSSDLIIGNIKALFDVSDFEFLAVFSDVLEEGWIAYYPYYANWGEAMKVSLREGERLELVSASMVEEYEQMPSRFTESSLLTKMETDKIGTKATRAGTIATLSRRGYIEKSGLELIPTSRGTELLENVEAFSSDIVSPKMTRTLEEKMEMIRIGSENEVDYLIGMFSSIRPVMKVMLHNRIEMTDSVSYINRGARPQNRVMLGKCPSCGKGRLELIRSTRTKKRFIRCTNFGKGCNTSAPAFPRGRIAPINRPCPSCGWPMVSYIYRRQRKSAVCSNFNCIKMRSN